MFVILLISLFGCAQETPTPIPISLEVQTSIPTGAGVNTELILDYNIVYLSEYVTGDGASAINIETGELIWRFSNKFISFANPVKTENNLYYLAIKDIDHRFTGPYYMFEVDPSNGTITTETELVGSNYGQSFYYISENNGVIFWHSGLNRDELIYYDTKDHSYGISYKFDHKLDINSEILFENNIAYIMYTMYHQTDINTTIPSGIIALELSEDGKTFKQTPRWKKTDLIGLDSGLHGSIEIKGDRLIALALVKLICLNKNTGDIIWTNNTCNGTGMGGMIFDSGRIYYSSSSYLDTDNLVCLDEETGVTIWTQSIRSQTIGGRPQIENGMLYLVTQDSLRIYNAKNGKYLAIDEKIKGDACYNKTYRYQDKLIIKSTHSTHPDFWGTLMVVRMNYK